MKRRSFLHALAASALLPPRAAAGRGAAARVDASATLFYAPPDARATLVRFLARDVQAPAGRLRVYDTARQLLATAGMIRRGAELYGELWLALGRGLTIQTELETPGARGVLRGRHRLEPQPRWTLHWMTVAPPDALARTLDSLPPPNQAVHGATLATAGVRGNPLPGWETLALLDHLPFLRMGWAARRIEQRFGVPASSVAVAVDPGAYPPTTPLALAGAGTPYVALPWREKLPFAWWHGPDGSRVLAVAVPRGADPRVLGFADGGHEMLQRVEQWLLSLPSALTAVDRWPGDAADGHVLVLGTEPQGDAAAMYRAVRDWNARYAFPRIVIGMGNDFVQQLERRERAIPVLPPPARHVPERPDGAALDAARAARTAAQGERVRHLLAPLIALVAPRATPSTIDEALHTVAAHVDSAVPGTLVFNPAPFPRTEPALMPDGRERVVTDVPALGYVFVPDAFFGEKVPPVTPEVGEASLHAERYRVRLDRETGAVVSLVTEIDGREWVRAERDGLNALPGAILEHVRREHLPRVGTRLVAQRWSPEHGDVRTTVTLYDALPWIDIVNETEPGGGRPIHWSWPFALERPRIRWEIPAGWDAAETPVLGLVHLRWLGLEADEHTVLMSAPDAPFASVTADGTVSLTSTPGRARVRLHLEQAALATGDAARVGWSTEPFLTARVSSGTSGPLPRFGSLLVVDQAGVAIVGLKPAERGRGVIVYLQELLGAGRFVSVGAGLLGFGPARVVDFLERDTGEDAAAVTEGAFTAIKPYGSVALRLDDVRLRGA